VDAQASVRWVPQEVLVEIARCLDPLSFRSFILSCKHSFEQLQDFFQHVRVTSGTYQLLRNLRLTDLSSCFVSGQLLGRVKELAGDRLRSVMTVNTKVGCAVLECAAANNDETFLEEVKASCTEEELKQLDVTPAVVSAMDLGGNRGSVHGAAFRVLRTFPSYNNLHEVVRSQVSAKLQAARIGQGIVIVLMAIAARYWGFL
jgi:hypothetical protein